MANNVHLPPELERFAKECVASGRYSSVGEVVRSGLRLLQEAEERRVRFNRMLDEVRTEAEHEGYQSIDQVLAEMDEVFAAQHNTRSGRVVDHRNLPEAFSRLGFPKLDDA